MNIYPLMCTCRKIRTQAGAIRSSGVATSAAPPPVATSDASTVNNREMPDISLQHMVAVMLLDKTASFAAAHDKPRMQDAAVLRERAKVELKADVELDKLHPARVSIVEVTLADGTKLSERVEAVR